MALPATGGALGKYSPLDVELAGPGEPLTIIIEHTADYDCDAASITVESVTVRGVAVVPVSVTEDPTNHNKATVVLPLGTPAGPIVVISSCDVGDGTPVAMGDNDFARLVVTKVVSGTVPPGTTFTVKVECVNRSGGTVLLTNLAYGETGGVHSVYIDDGTAGVCTITEPVNGGATSTTITPAEVDVNDDDDFPVTVLNEFPVAIEPNFTG